MPKFSKRSKDRLYQCDIRLQVIFEEIIKYYDCTILTGHRGKEEQDKAWYEGRSKVKYPGSKHNRNPSLAIDVAPYPIPKDWGEKKWKEKVKFYQLAAIVLYEAKKQGINIRTGMDWNMNGDYTDQKWDDLVHFEIKD